MSKNVGMVDRSARILAGIALIALVAFGGLMPPWSWVAIVVALVLVLTAAVGFCPAYRLIGMRTCPVDPA